MFRRRFLIIPAVLFGGAALAGWGYGHHGRCGRNPEKMERRAKAFVEDRLDDLDATDPQRKQIVAITTGLLAEFKALHAEHEDAREQFLSFWESDKPDPKAVHAALDARIEKLRAVAHKVADAGLAVHGTLDKNQRDQVTEHLREHGCGK